MDWIDKISDLKFRIDRCTNEQRVGLRAKRDTLLKNGGAKKVKKVPKKKNSR